MCSASFGKKKAIRRYHDDVWIFNISSETWSQPAPGITDSDGESLRAWEDCPPPRGSHGACLVEDTMVPEDQEDAAEDASVGTQLRRRLFVFGGYGEAGGNVMFGRTVSWSPQLRFRWHIEIYFCSSVLVHIICRWSFVATLKSPPDCVCLAASSLSRCACVFVSFSRTTTTCTL